MSEYINGTKCPRGNIIEKDIVNINNDIKEIKRKLEEHDKMWRDYEIWRIKTEAAMVSDFDVDSMVDKIANKIVTAINAVESTGCGQVVVNGKHLLIALAILVLVVLLGPAGTAEIIKAFRGGG